MIGSAKFFCPCWALLAFVCLNALADPINNLNASPPPLASATPNLNAVDDCLQKDSISCLQMQAYKSIRSFFGQDNIELFGGLSLVKNPEPRARALELNSADVQIAETKDVEKRETILEDFTVQRVANFFDERSLQWNFSPMVNEVTQTARSVVDSIPSEMKTTISKFIEEGRGKKKKLLKALGPLLIALKMKLAAFAGLAYLVIALIAKKALFASVVSLLISGFIAIKKLLSQQNHGHHEVVEHHPHGHGFSGSGYSSGGWDSGYGGGSSGGHDIHGSYSNNVAHTLAYNGQKANRRR